MLMVFTVAQTSVSTTIMHKGHSLLTHEVSIKNDLLRRQLQLEAQLTTHEQLS